MTNLEAYFRTYGIKIAQESFPDPNEIKWVEGYRNHPKYYDANQLGQIHEMRTIEKFSREWFAMYGLNRDEIPKRELYAMGAMTELERREYFDMVLGIPKHLDGDAST